MGPNLEDLGDRIQAGIAVVVVVVVVVTVVVPAVVVTMGKTSFLDFKWAPYLKDVTFRQPVESRQFSMK